MNYQQVIPVLVVVFGLVGTIQAGWFGPSKRDEVRECRKKLEQILADVRVPEELHQVVETIRGMDDAFLKNMLTSIRVSKYFNTNDYTEHPFIPADLKLFKAASEFYEKASQALARVDCKDETDLLKLTDIGGKHYLKYLNRNTIIDEFNAFAYLAKEIIEDP